MRSTVEPRGPESTASDFSLGDLARGGQFTTIDFPNATFTSANGINNNGQIVGEYQDAAGNTHGFLLSGGRFTSLNYPKATYTQVMKINLAGQIVGRYQSADGTWHGFLLSGGTYTAINFPNTPKHRGLTFKHGDAGPCYDHSLWAAR